MKSFLTRHQSEVKGVLSGFDRVRFRGTLRLIANLRGLSRWLSHHGVLLKSFKEFAMGLTETIPVNRLRTGFSSTSGEAPSGPASMDCAAGVDPGPAEVPVPLLRLCRSRIRLDARTTSNVATDVDPSLPQRTRVSGSPAGQGGHRLRETRQLLHSDRRSTIPTDSTSGEKRPDMASS